MNREAALLGVPTYSVFTGKKPYLDEYLEKEGRLAFINTVEDIDRIQIKKREIMAAIIDKPGALAEEIYNTILSLGNKS